MNDILQKIENKIAHQTLKMNNIIDEQRIARMRQANAKLLNAGANLRAKIERENRETDRIMAELDFKKTKRGINNPGGIINRSPVARPSVNPAAKPVARPTAKPAARPAAVAQTVIKPQQVPTTTADKFSTPPLTMRAEEFHKMLPIDQSRFSVMGGKLI
jgi:hypothetical protein